MLRLLAASVLLVSGCSANGVTINQTQALTRVEQLIRDTANGLTPRPELEQLPMFTAPTACLDEDKSQDQITVSRAYWLRGVPKSENVAISRQVRAYWEAHGHRITSIGGTGNPGVTGESRPDGFTMTLTWVEGDSLYLGAASPCVWPDGTPSP
ncbi:MULTISPECIES: hypothetical protein [unclassified Nonomuraea]|uniref:hypothetical protein n=1 Tax=unclassified Nonomuraea TaxID=2593643 RepID=UPI0034030CCF